MKGKFVFNDNYCYAMPPYFGGVPFSPEGHVMYDSCLGISVNQMTDINALARFVPEDLELLEGRINWCYCNCRGVDFLAGGEYRIFQATVPVSLDVDGKTIEGQFPLVIFEDVFGPIRGGREDCGMPKVYADISTDRHVGNHWYATVSIDNIQLLQMNFNQGAKVADEIVTANRAKANADPNHVIGLRYFNNIGKPGAAVKEIVNYPQLSGVTDVWLGDASVKLTVPQRPYMAGYVHIISALASLPVYSWQGALRTMGNLDLKCNGCTVLKDLNKK